MSYQLPATSYEQDRVLSTGVSDTGYGLRTTGYAAGSDQGLPAVAPGQVAVLSGEPGLGMTRLGLVMLSGYAEGTVAYLDVRGWLSPVAAWEVGIEPDRLVIARCNEVVQWGRAAAALLDGAVAVMAEIPVGVKDVSIRRLAALARNRGPPCCFVPSIVRCQPVSLIWCLKLARPHGRVPWAGTVASSRGRYGSTPLGKP